MIKLSDRLELIANRIESGETMADIGTDHGFLPLYLKLSGKSPKVIMADVSLPSLDKARENAARFAASEDNIHFRAGNGLTVLERGEVDAVVIAGMGGKLIRDIMAADLEHTYSFKKFILQPRIGQGYLRKWLCDNGFTITHEDVVIEGHHIPEIITVLSPEVVNETEKSGENIEAVMPIEYAENAGKSTLLANFGGENLAELSVYEMLKSFDGDDVRWRIPPWMRDAEGTVREFLAKNIAMTELKLDNIRKAKKRDISLEKQVEEEIEYLKNLQDLQEERENGR